MNVQWARTAALLGWMHGVSVCAQPYLEVLTVHEHFGIELGHGGAITYQAEGADVPILIVSATKVPGANGYWYAVVYDPVSSTYRIEHVSPVRDSKVTALALQDHASTQTDRLLVGYEDGVLEVVSLPDYVAVSSHAASASAIRQIILADADNSGSQDVLAISNEAIEVLTSDDYQSQNTWHFESVDVAVGNVDEDIFEEIVLAQGISGEVLEIRNGVITSEWAFPPGGFGLYVELANIDSTEWAEVISANEFERVSAFNVASQERLWFIDTNSSPDSLSVQDVRGDDRPEILLGSRDFTGLRVYGTLVPVLLWTYPTDEDHVNFGLVGDMDNDGRVEVVLADGPEFRTDVSIYVYDALDQSSEFRSRPLNGRFVSPVIRDLYGDGSEKLVFADTELSSGSEEPTLYIYDIASGQRTFRSEPNFLPFFGNKVPEFTIADVDNDTELEIALAVDDVFSGGMTVLSAAGAIEYTTAVNSEHIAAADIDRDGTAEVVVSHENEIFVLDGASGELEWQTLSLDDFSGTSSLSIGNIDADPALEIVFSKSFLYTFDGVSRSGTQSPSLGYNGVGLLANGATASDTLFAGRLEGTLVQVDAADLSALPPLFGCIAPVNGVAAFGAAAGTVLVHDCFDQVIARSAGDGNVIWISEPTFADSNLGGNIGVFGMNGVGHRIVFPTHTGVRVYESDTDSDGVVDSRDNCQLVANVSQVDADEDGYGNACDADLDNDMQVNVVDLGIFRLAFLTSDPVADLNSDGIVNALDLGIFKSLFLSAPGPSGLVP